MTEDSQFGPVVLFGQGGVAVEQLADRALALPPLTLALAREMIEAMAFTIVKLSQLVTNLDEVGEIDINPLQAGPEGVIALDVRIRLADHPRGLRCLAIRPHPTELESDVGLDDGRLQRLRWSGRRTSRRCRMRFAACPLPP